MLAAVISHRFSRTWQSHAGYSVSWCPRSCTVRPRKKHTPTDMNAVAFPSGSEVPSSRTPMPNLLTHADRFIPKDPWRVSLSKSARCLDSRPFCKPCGDVFRTCDSPAYRPRCKQPAENQRNPHGRLGESRARAARDTASSVALSTHPSRPLDCTGRCLSIGYIPSCNKALADATGLCRRIE